MAIQLLQDTRLLYNHASFIVTVNENWDTALFLATL